MHVAGFLFSSDWDNFSALCAWNIKLRENVKQTIEQSLEILSLTSWGNIKLLGNGHPEERKQLSCWLCGSWWHNFTASRNVIYQREKGNKTRFRNPKKKERKSSVNLQSESSEMSQHLFLDSKKTSEKMKLVIYSPRLCLVFGFCFPKVFPSSSEKVVSVTNVYHSNAWRQFYDIKIKSSALS